MPSTRTPGTRESEWDLTVCNLALSPLHSRTVLESNRLSDKADSCLDCRKYEQEHDLLARKNRQEHQ